MIVFTVGTCGGRPRVAGTRIPTYGLNDLYMAGDSIESIARTFEIDESDVIDAIAFEQMLTTRMALLKLRLGFRDLALAIAYALDVNQ